MMAIFQSEIDFSGGVRGLHHIPERVSGRYTETAGKTGCPTGKMASVTAPHAPTAHRLERDLAGDFVHVVEEAAIAAARTMGQGDRSGSDQAAVQAMRRAFEDVQIAGNIVIGEGERDEAPHALHRRKSGRSSDGRHDLSAGGYRRRST